MKKVIVTGAGGFIGGSLVKRFLELGVEVYGVGRSHMSLMRFMDNDNFHGVCASFDDYSSLAEAINCQKPDAFYHLAWAGKLSSSDLMDVDIQLGNVKAATSAAEAAIKLGSKRFVFCSSSYQSLVDEKTNTPVNVYGLCKKTAQDLCYALCTNTGTGYNSAILTNTFGVGDHSKKAVNFFIKTMLENKPLSLVKGEHKNDWLYIDDTVNGLVNIGTKGLQGKHYYIGHRKITKFKEKLTEMKDVLMSRSEMNFGQYPETTYIDYDRFDLDALYNDTGFECKADFKESILKTAEWVKGLDWDAH